jgi:hypothetical protein
VADFTRARSAPSTATLLTVVGGAFLVVAAFVGVGALATAVVVLQLAAAASWHDLLRAPGARAGSLIGLASGVAATVTLALGTSQGPSGALSVVAVGGLFLAFGQQLVTGDEGRARLTALTATAALVVIEVLAASWLSAASVSDGAWVVTAGAVGAVLAVLAVATGGTSSWVVGGGLLVCAGAGALLGVLGPPGLGSTAGAGVAAAAGLAAVCGVQVRRLAGRSARTAPATVAALPLVVAGPATFIAARILLG